MQSRSVEDLRSGRQTDNGVDVLTDAVITRSGRVMLPTPPIKSNQLPTIENSFQNSPRDFILHRSDSQPRCGTTSQGQRYKKNREKNDYRTHENDWTQKEPSFADMGNQIPLKAKIKISNKKSKNINRLGFDDMQRLFGPQQNTQKHILARSHIINILKPDSSQNSVRTLKNDKEKSERSSLNIKNKPEILTEDQDPSTQKKQGEGVQMNINNYLSNISNVYYINDD